MFYVKTEIGDSCTIKIEITDENVFTTCPGCGAEHLVDIVEMLHDPESDLFSTSSYCPECAKKIQASNPQPEAALSIEEVEAILGRPHFVRE